VLPTLDNPYFSEVLTAAQQYAQAKGYTLVVVPAGGEPAQAITALQGGAYDGVILAGRATCSAPEVMELTRRGLATIVLQEHSPDSTLPSVRVDLEEGGYLATRHLIQLGHTRIAHVTEALPQQRSRPGRLEGYRLALREAALPFDPALVLIAPNSMEGGCEAIRTLLEMKRSRRPTAAFMYNDLMAFGALREARRHRVDVPRDLAIVGFDGVAMGQYTVPMLTTIDHPRAALGVAAIETLIDVINGNPLRTERLLPVELVIRESCGGAAHQQASHPLSTGRTKGSTRM
jgi:LacI family transcriptional regulator